MTEIQRLQCRLEELKNANMMSAKPLVDAVLTQMKVVFNEFDQRIERLESLYENVEVMKK